MLKKKLKHPETLDIAHTHTHTHGILYKTCKIIIALIISFILLTIFCYFYSNSPVHYSSSDGATDYVWEKNKFYSKATEGFAFGKTNNEGYINKIDYNENTNIDILVMGSSHMEAFQVDMENNTASKLGKLLNKQVYNIGISGHNFLICTCNLKSAVEKYKPSEYTIIETDRVTFSNQDLENAINGKIPEIQSHTGGIIGLLQKNQFLRVLYGKLKDFTNKNNDIDVEDLEKNDNYEETQMDAELLNKLFEKMNEDIKQSVSNKIIIVYHPSIELNYDGSISLLHNKEDVETFENLCKKNNIYFLDMSNRFENEYINNHKLPYGFNNSTIGTGHLNEDGHSMIANELYKLIKEVE